MQTQTAKKVWDDAARGWDDGYEWYASNVRPLTDWICDSVAASGARVLDVACGTGQPAMALAERVGPTGTVVATDFSPRMVAAAERRAQAVGLGNIEFHEMNAEDLRFEDGTFDGVSCMCGLMFSEDPVRPLAEIRRVLTPNGRFALAVWDEPSKNPFFTLIGNTVAAVLPQDLPEPNKPGAWSLSQHGELERVLSAAGLTNWRIESRAMTYEVESVETYWRLFTRFAAGVAQKLANVPDGEVARAKDQLRASVEKFVQGGRLRLTATALCASGRRD